jgi:hypothetical protein
MTNSDIAGTLEWVAGLIERLRDPTWTTNQHDPKAVYRTRPVSLFEEAAALISAQEAEIKRLSAIPEAEGGSGSSRSQPCADLQAGSPEAQSFAGKWRKKHLTDAVQVNTAQEAANTPGVCIGGRGCPRHGGPDSIWPHVHALEGEHRWSPGDWLITGIQGEHYFCKPDIFAATYEPADQSASNPSAPPQLDSRGPGRADEGGGT